MSRARFFVAIAIVFLLSASVSQPKKAVAQDGNADLLIAKINSYRENLGLSPVLSQEVLNCAAQIHAMDIGPRELCRHTGHDGTRWQERAAECGTIADGEMLICGSQNESEALRYILSKDHYRKIISDPFLLVAGSYVSNNYWVIVWRRIK